jgi:hypothetical protein
MSHRRPEAAFSRPTNVVRACDHPMTERSGLGSSADEWQDHNGKAKRDQDASENGANEVEVMPDAIRSAPSHSGENVEPLGDVRKNYGQ